MHLIKLTENELGFAPKYEYFISVDDEMSQPKFYKREGNRLVEKKSTSHCGRYNQVSFSSKYDGYKTVSVHRIVVKTFAGCVKDSLEIDHIDTNTHNNCISNLRLATRKENCNNRTTLEHLKTAMENHGLSTKKRIYCIDATSGSTIQVYDSLTDAERDGYNRTDIRYCCSGKRKTHGGFIWKYVDESEEANYE